MPQITTETRKKVVRPHIHSCVSLVAEYSISNAKIPSKAKIPNWVRAHREEFQTEKNNHF